MAEEPEHVPPPPSPPAPAAATDDEPSSPPSLPPVKTDDPSLLNSFVSSLKLEETPDVWAAQPFSPPPPPLPSTTSSTTGNDAPPPAAPYLDDLDPFAPSHPFANSASLGSIPPRIPYLSHQTLGHNVKGTSRLEILPDSDASSSSSSPDQTSPTSSFGTLPSTPVPTGAKSRPTETGLGVPPSSSNSFLGGVFRSISGSPAPPPSSSKPSSPAPPPPPPRFSTPTPGTKDDSTTGGGAGTTTPTPSSNHMPNPLASIASVFRSASSRPTSQSSTPTAGTSPTRTAGGEKAGAGAALMEQAAVNRNKEKEAAAAPVVEPEPQFDFAKFLEQMRSRSADPIAKYLRSFLKEFSRRPPVSTNDQVRVINDFLDFIAGKMRNVEPWRGLFVQYEAERAEVEFDLAMEAMEKLVMNRLWHLTFTPALDLSALPDQTSPTGDVERDHVLSQRIRLFAWIKPVHLDLPIPDPSLYSPSTSRPTSPPIDFLSEKSDELIEKERSEMDERKRVKQVMGFLDFAQRELSKMNQYKAPRDKLICVLNCCKVIFGLIRHVSTDEGADTFIPFLIYIVLKSNPEHLISNLQYIQRFRNPEKLSGEGGYYLSSLSGAISFIETMDASSLSSLTQAEFEQNVASAILALPVDPNDATLRRDAAAASASSVNTSPPLNRSRASPPPPLSQAPTEGVDTESPALLQQPGLSFPDATKAFLLRSTDSVERIVSKPLGAIGRIFDEIEKIATPGDGPPPSQPSPRSPHGQQPLPPLPPPGAGAPLSANPKRRSYATYQGGAARSQPPPPPSQAGPGGQDPRLYAPEGSTNEEVIRVLEEKEEKAEQQRLAAIETLRSVFPGMEDEVLEMVLLSNSGDMSRTIDALLEMS